MDLNNRKTKKIIHPPVIFVETKQLCFGKFAQGLFCRRKDKIIEDKF